MHLEAYLDNPLQNTWTVQLVDEVVENRNSVFKMQAYSEARTLKSGISFIDAIDMLAAFEKDIEGDTGNFRPTVPNATLLDFLHFRAFAEREGYVYDVSGSAQARPDANALPPDAFFYEADVERADKHMQRPPEAFQDGNVQSKIPHAHFLFDHFRVAAQKRAIPETRVISLMDHFVGHISTMNQKLHEYCATYEQLGKGGLIIDAEQSLDTAFSVLNQLKAYGLDISGFEKFAQECRVTCGMLHAIGIYDLMSRGKADTVVNEPIFQKRLSDTVAAYKKIDASSEGEATLKHLITHAERPEVPPAIQAFLDGHKKARDAFYRPAPPRSPPPHAP